LSGDELRVLADEQAALRRVATLVARGAAPQELFAAAVEEVGRLLPVDLVGMGRYESDYTQTIIASWGKAVEHFPVGFRPKLGGHNLVTVVLETGRPARMDSYVDASGAVGSAARDSGFRSSVGTPIIVEGRVWGVVIAGSSAEEPLPADTEARLAQFTELLATAIANAESRAGLARLAEEQAALRRLATLVAGGALPAEVFAGAVQEVARLLPVAYAHMGRYEPDGVLTIVATSGGVVDELPVGTRLMVEDTNLARLVFETGRPARLDDYPEVSGPLGDIARKREIRSSVATPVIVEGQLWGVMAAGTMLGERVPPDIEARLGEFTELLATAIANADSRAALAASRARLVAAADETRRRIERDLHDGIQQRLVSLGLELRAAQATVPPEHGELELELARIADGLATVFEELREISRGIHPAVLSERGLVPALRALGRRSAVPVELDLHAERRFPDHVEAAAYYVVSEALTNAVKHAHASMVHVALDVPEATVRLAIHDDGVGGADPAQGSGLIGISDRIEALGGTLQVTSPAGSGTMLLIGIPL
jgi:signal transduction histidine kinase